MIIKRDKDKKKSKKDIEDEISLYKKGLYTGLGAAGLGGAGIISTRVNKGGSKNPNFDPGKNTDPKDIKLLKIGSPILAASGLALGTVSGIKLKKLKKKLKELEEEEKDNDIKTEEKN